MTLYGAILTGGENSRMDGFPKGKLRINGQRLFDRVRNALAPVVDEIMVSVHDERPLQLPDSLSIIRDELNNNRSSMNGVYSVLSELEAPVIIVPWDMPYVSSEILSMLTGDDSDSDSHGTFFRSDECLQPFPGLYGPGLTEPLHEALRQGHYSLRKLLEDRRVTIIPAPDRDALKSSVTDPFINLNSPEDLEDWTDG